MDSTDRAGAMPPASACPQTSSSAATNPFRCISCDYRDSTLQKTPRFCPQCGKRQPEPLCDSNKDTAKSKSPPKSHSRKQLSSTDGRVLANSLDLVPEHREIAQEGVVVNPANGTELTTTERERTQTMQSRMPEHKRGGDSSRSVSTDGIKAPCYKSAKVTFHVLISKECWEWNQNSTLHIRFDDQELGCRKSELGDFEEVRDYFNNGVFEMVHTFTNFDVEVIKRCPRYEYVVRSRGLCVEQFYSCKDYRCLEFSSGVSVQPEGEYHKFDTIAYPPNVKIFKPFKNMTGMLQDDISSNVNREDVEISESSTPPSYEKMVCYCLETYLQKYKETLCDEYEVHDKDGIHSTAINICLICRAIFNECSTSDSQKALVESLRVWFESVVNLIDSKITSNYRKISSATCIVYCIVQLVDTLDVFSFPHDLNKFLLQLARLLRFHPITAKEEYRYLLTQISSDWRSSLSSAISTFCDNLAGKEFVGTVDWLLIIPLFHFLSSKIEFYSEPTLDFQLESTIYNKLGLQKITQKAIEEQDVVLNCFDKVSKYFEMDPLLLKLFCSVVPDIEFDQLCEKIPPFLSAEVLLKRAHFKGNQWIKNLQSLKSRIRHSEETKYKYLSAMVTSSLSLCKKLSSQKLSSSDGTSCLHLIASGFSCAFCALERFHSQFKSDEDNRLKQDHLTCLESLLKEWIIDDKVIGGFVFGRVVQSVKKKVFFQKGRDELKVWQFWLDWSREVSIDKQCTSVKEWCQMIENIVKERIQKTEDVRPKIDLVCEMETIDNIHPTLEGTVMDAALKAVDSQAEKQDIDFEKLPKDIKSQRVGVLLGRIFDKRYPNFSTELTLENLFKWDHWSRFINICERQPELKEGLSDNCIKACTFAKDHVKQVCEELENRKVVVTDLLIVTKDVNQLLRLYDASTSFYKGEMSKALSDLEKSIRDRTEEYDFFLQHQHYLQHICRFLNNVKGVDKLREEVDEDYRKMELKQLCQRDPENGDQINVLQFQSAGSLRNFIADFSVLSESQIFKQLWNSAILSALNCNPDLSLNDLYSEVWQLSFDQCKELVGSLSSLHITLAAVDKHLKPYEKTLSLDTELNALFKCCTKCTMQKFNQEDIDLAIIKVKRFCSVRHRALVFLKIRDCLGLESDDFLAIENLLKELNECQMLKDVNDRVIKSGSVFENFAMDPGKLKCLETFVKCENIVKWLKEVTKDVNEIQSFVNVALATSAGGEGDFPHDKLSNLRVVGRGFSALIYIQVAGFKELMKACTSVLQAFDAKPDLPTMLEECNKNIDWYQSVKDTQGSVEVTSYGQMRNILNYGCYEIGTSDHTKPGQSIHDLISLKLNPRNKQLTKTSYNLDELRDLESKLVLITGSKAENRIEVDHYLHILQNVVRIADVLLALQQAGNVNFIGHVIRFDCSVCVSRDSEDSGPHFETLASQIVKELLSSAKVLEDTLLEWKKEVKGYRSFHYDLNYFTTLQLLRLRKELGFVRQNPYKVVHPEVLTLLQCISPQITTEHVRDVVRNLRVADCNDTVTEASKLVANKSLALQKQMVALPENCYQLDDTRMDYVVGVSSKSAVSPGYASISSNESSRENIKPVLTKELLNERQMQNFTDLVEKYNFSELLVLKAIEDCHDDANIYDLLDLCEELDDTLNANDSEVNNQPYASSDESDSDEDGTVSILLTSDVQHSEKPIPNKPRIEIIQRTCINSSHPVVQQLVNDYAYELEASIEAVKLCGGSLNEAMKYLDTNEGRELSEVPDIIESAVEDSKLNTKNEYLTLNELGIVLGNLRLQLPAYLSNKRTFLDDLKTGSPNLIVTSPAEVLRYVLALYMEDESLPLPNLDEILICTSSTTAEEVNIFWQRVVGDPEFKRIFCLVHAEKLVYQVCDKIIGPLNNLSHSKKEYRLVIVCSKEGENNSLLVSKLLLHKKSILLKHDTKKCQTYLKHHLIHKEIQENNKASIVDIDRSCVRIVTSKLTGMGKSLFIQRMAEKLAQIENVEVENCLVTIPIHGPVVTADTLMDFLKDHYEDNKCVIYHFDIPQNVLSEVSSILLSLLILRGLTDSQGRVWRCHPSQLYAIEVTMPGTDELDKHDTEANTVNLLNLLPTIECLTPKQAIESIKTGSSYVGIDKESFQSGAYQKVYENLLIQYGDFSGDNCAHCLKLLLRACQVKDPTWSEIRYFVQFLHEQLDSCNKSEFFNETLPLIKETMPGLMKFVTKFMIRMSKDFATPTLRGELFRERRQLDCESLDLYEIDSKRRWEDDSHPYIFFNKDGITITFVGFVITKDGHLYDSKNQLLECNVIDPNLYIGLVRQGVNFNEGCYSWKRETLIEKLSMVMGLRSSRDPDRTYVLTVDNLIKMLAIQMRFRCGIPVVIIGETGCGKTRLIRYMCDLAKEDFEQRDKDKLRNMMIMKVHGGTKENDIITFISAAERQAHINREYNLDTVVFFDEANTTDCINVIKEIMCDGRLNGRLVSTDLKFIAACNPYRRHSDEMIKKLEASGLGFHVQVNKTKQKLGKIPLRQLVYRVHELPPSMRPLVYDFGQLRDETEQHYVIQIVEDHVKKYSLTVGIDVLSIAMVLSVSQAYMKETKDECSFVSLRDVERALIVFNYFYEKINHFKQADKKFDHTDVSESPEKDVTRALIMAVYICYSARLWNRDKFETMISSKFHPPLILLNGKDQFRKEIIWFQNVLLDNMVIGPNIAKNAALRENVFLMTICIELRIPLFLVGKPGSSKSLAKSIIHDSMHGKTSHCDLLKHFKQVHMFSYQCSQLATPESVIEVFRSAKKFQSKQDIKHFTSVVVLDEVGLAEDSPSLPLKSLHPLLEDGTEGAGANGKDEVIERENRVAFIGISNWALDPAKMNRGIMVTRGIPDVEELKLSALGICGTEDKDKIEEILSPYFQPLAEAYEAICSKQEREFFGLRDFYSLIKMLYWMCKKSKSQPLTWPQMKHAIMRNFGGLKSENLDPLNEFEIRLNMDKKELVQSAYDKDIWPVVSPTCTRLGIISSSLDTKEMNFYGENRYLLFLTEDFAALDILERYIKGHQHDPTQIPSGYDPKKPYSEALTMFGSSFPKDKDYTQVCRNINQIKICMETGRTVILLNLDNLYESLYDVLNQYYMHYGDNRYVDLGLQTHRVKCRVHKDFKLILIAEKDVVHEKFPTPLINRLEKHFVLASSLLSNWQEDVLNDLMDWIIKFSTISDVKQFRKGHAFIGYQKDTPAAVVFQSSKQVKEQVVQKSSSAFLQHIPISELDIEAEGSEVWKQAVLNLSKYLLLQTASDDALVRLKTTAIADQQQELMHLYFVEQHHNSIIDFLTHQLKSDERHEGLLMQVTTHSHLMLRDEVENLGVQMSVSVGMKLKIEYFHLQEFDTEQDFSTSISTLLQRENDDYHSYLIVIQCESGHMNGDLIACARYCIYNERVKALKRNKIHSRNGVSHILLIIHLPHQVSSSSFVSFQGHPWTCAHVDDLRSSSVDILGSVEVTSATISKMFIGSKVSEVTQKHACGDEICVEQDKKAGIHQHSDGRVNDRNGSLCVPEQMSMMTSDKVTNRDNPKSGEVHPTARCEHLYAHIQAAASKLDNTTKERSIQQIKCLTKLIPKKPDHDVICRDCFYCILVMHVYRLLLERECNQSEISEWILSEALNISKLEVGGTFRNVLARKIDEVVIPIFAKIIASIDCYCNLDIINPKDAIPATTKLWLAMFRKPNILQLNYYEVLQCDKVPCGIKSSRDSFKCKMPFFWIIKDAVETSRSDFKSHAVVSVGENWPACLNHFHKCIQTSAVGKVLESVDHENDEHFYKLYLHDFVRSVHWCKHKSSENDDLEYQLISEALNHMVNNCVQQHESLISRIAALHLAHQASIPKIHWFGQVSSQHPSIKKSLLGTLPRKGFPEMELHLFAAVKVMDIKLEPPLHNDNPNQNLSQWMDLFKLSQATIDSIMTLNSHTDIFVKARRKWQRLRAIRLFVENIMLKYPNMEDFKVFVKRLSGRLMDDTIDFLKVNTIKTVMLIIKNMLKALIKKQNVIDKKVLKDVKKSCRVFFMNLLCDLTFGGQTAPEPALIRMLLDMVFTDAESSTKDLIPYEVVRTDKVPTIRSFLLQLLLEHNMDQVRDHLKHYLQRCQQLLIAANDPSVDQNLHLLIIKCFEDAMNKKLSFLSLPVRAQKATVCVKQGYDAIKTHQLKTPTIEYLEGVAKARYSLSIVAEVLKSNEEDENFVKLLKTAGPMCTDSSINLINPSNPGCSTGPVIYLLKLIARQYGMPCLKAAADDYHWIVPSDVILNEEKLTDPFVIHGEPYINIRKAADVAINTVDGLQELTQNMQMNVPYVVVYFVLAVYVKATLSRTSSDSAKKISDNAIEIIDEFITKSKLLSEEVKFIARALLVNKQGGVLKQMSVSLDQPLHCRTIMGVVVHSAIVFLNRQRIDLLQPFVNMLKNPAALIQCYLPTMPDYCFVEEKETQAINQNGIFLECKRGHKVFISFEEYTKTMGEGTCRICLDPVGAADHRMNDAVLKGHILGESHNRVFSFPQRKLTVRAVCILRALMHSTLIWASCHNRLALEAIGHIVSSTVSHVIPDHLPEYFWAHLEKDFELLELDTGRGLDECVMIMHLVLRKILTTKPPEDTSIQYMSSLISKQDRVEWEDVFNQRYIAPVLTNLEVNLSQAIDTTAKDNTQSPSQLLTLIYEKENVGEEEFDRHLWTYRSTVTLKHLQQTMQEKEITEKHPILHEFLQIEVDLRATQYIPDIVKLQQRLFDKYNHLLYEADAKKQTIKRFLEEVKDEATKREYIDMFASFKAAWALVGHKLKYHGRLPVPQKYFVGSISDDTSMEYLIPNTTEAGVCSTALVDFLTLTHNKFIERCRAIILRLNQSKVSCWSEHKVPIAHLHRCHLVDYEQQLPSIILSHCQYSLQLGKGQDVKYDIQALEKHILNRFIHGKPLIILDIPQVVYRSDIYTMDTFDRVKKKVKPQERLPQRLSQDIIAELNSPNRLRQALDVIEIILGFLSSGGGRANKPLGEYIDKTLKMSKKSFSQKAKDSCQLKHALSLWETVAVELARQLYFQNQEPFDGIHDNFLRELSENENGENQLKALDSCLGHFDLEVLQGTLFEFIETYVKYSRPQEHSLSLAELIHLKLPASIKLDQAVATWKHIVLYSAEEH